LTHNFDVSDANRYGVEKAILLSHIKFWIAKNKANEKNLIDGRTWTYNSAEAFAKLFPYWKSGKIARLLRELEEEKILRSANHNQAKYDRTKWYAFEDEESILQDWNFHYSNLNNGISKTERPIPDIKPDTKPDTKPYTEEFEVFWNQYPRKIGKRSASKCWNARIKDHEISKIMTCLDGYRKKLKAEGTEERFIMYASTFLNAEERFLDFESWKKSSGPKDGRDDRDNLWKDGKIVGHYDGSRYIPHTVPKAF